MMQLLVLRERVKSFYQRYDAYLTPIIKFIFAFIAFQTINKEVGYDPRFESFTVVFVLSLLSAFTPSAIMVLLGAFLAAVHIYAVSPILSIIVIMILLVIYLLFARYAPKYGYVLLAVPVLFILNIPYIIPILLGLIASPVAIVPTSCGVVLYYLLQVMKSAVNMQINMSVEDILQVYKYVIDNMIGNKIMIMTIVIFALILLVTYFVRRMTFDYAFEIAIAAGSLTSILGFVVSDLMFNNSNHIITMILGTIGSGIIVYFIHFFKLTLDYSEATYAQFEDDVYYYYVKAVPKVSITTPQKNVKHFNVKPGDHTSTLRNVGNVTQIYDDEDDMMDEVQDNYEYDPDGVNRKENQEDNR